MKTKPGKPYDDFPLFAHGNGQWARKINGKLYYFGTWDKPQEALDRYLKDRDFLYAGQTPPDECDTVADVLNAFLGSKEVTLEAGEISHRTYSEYEAVCDTIADTLGKRRAVENLTRMDLDRLRSVLGKGKSGQQVSPVTHKRLLTFARMVFLFASEELGLNVRYKKALKSPSARIVRQSQNGERLYNASDIRKLVKRATGDIEGMILLGINAAFGPMDCHTLRKTDGEWLEHPRSKTGVPRRVWLWPETRSAIADRLPFRQLTTRHSIAHAFQRVADDCGVDNHGLYTLRRTFETIAGTAGVGQFVVDRIMGHAPRSGDMAEVYRQRVFDDQLRKCSKYVRDWYLGKVSIG